MHPSYLLRVYNSAMSGGLGFAVEVNEEFRLLRAVNAAYYFGLTDLATLLADLITHDQDGAYAGRRQATSSSARSASVRGRGGSGPGSAERCGRTSRR
jgi:hypothetical protein